jgi:hypothetical protein
MKQKSGKPVLFFIAERFEFRNRFVEELCHDFILASFRAMRNIPGMQLIPAAANFETLPAKMR